MFRPFSLHYFRRSLCKDQISFRIFLKSLKAHWTTRSGITEMIGIMLMVSLLTGKERRELQTQFPASGIELGNSSQFHFSSSHSVSTMAAATNPIATPIKGLSTANQKETFQPESLALGFLFMLFSQADKHRYFTKREISFATATTPSRNGQRWR